MERPWVFGHTELTAMICWGDRQTRVSQSAIVFLLNRGYAGTGAPNKNIVQNHLNIALLNVF